MQACLGVPYYDEAGRNPQQESWFFGMELRGFHERNFGLVQIAGGRVTLLAVYA